MDEEINEVQELTNNKANRHYGNNIVFGFDDDGIPKYSIGPHCKLNNMFLTINRVFFDSNYWFHDICRILSFIIMY